MRLHGGGYVEVHQGLSLSIIDAEPSIWQQGEVVEAKIEVYTRSAFSLSTRQHPVTQHT